MGLLLPGVTRTIGVTLLLYRKRWLELKQSIPHCLLLRPCWMIEGDDLEWHGGVLGWPGIWWWLLYCTSGVNGSWNNLLYISRNCCSTKWWDCADMRKQERWWWLNYRTGGVDWSWNNLFHRLRVCCGSKEKTSVTWSVEDYGGDSSTEQVRGIRVDTIYPTHRAVLKDGTVVRLTLVTLKVYR